MLALYQASAPPCRRPSSTCPCLSIALSSVPALFSLTSPVSTGVRPATPGIGPCLHQRAQALAQYPRLPCQSILGLYVAVWHLGQIVCRFRPKLPATKPRSLASSLFTSSLPHTPTPNSILHLLRWPPARPSPSRLGFSRLICILTL